MNFNSVTQIHVYYVGRLEKISMGRLGIKDRQIFFEYSPEFLASTLELSPFILPLKAGVVACPDRIFEGLFGIFNDSLPDGWGRLLLDRKLAQLGIHPNTVSPLDRLCYVGSQGMGALIYEPEIKGATPLHHHNFDTIEEEILQFQAQDNHFIDDLLALNGSSAGARPKIVLQLDGIHWIIKFRSSNDPIDIGAIEYAYHLMAKAAKLKLPEAKLFPSQKGAGYFGCKRFDRTANQRFHMHTMSGLLHLDHRTPNLDYEAIVKTTRWLTKNIQECEQQFRIAVFNVLTHNRDDHAKNFSFLMDEQGTWRVSPAYDLTFSTGPAGEHCTTLMGEGKSPTLSHCLKLAEICEINLQKALHIIEEVAESTAQWAQFAKQAGVTKQSAQLIQQTLTQLRKSFK